MGVWAEVSPPWQQQYVGSCSFLLRIFWLGSRILLRLSRMCVSVYEFESVSVRAHTRSDVSERMSEFSTRHAIMQSIFSRSWGRGLTVY